LWHIGVLIASACLGIFWTFRTPTGEFTGFANSQWCLFLIALPLATFLVGYYLRRVDHSLRSLDRLIKPLDESPVCFSVFLAERFRLHWFGWIFRLSILLPLVLTIIADGEDILAPLQSPLIPVSIEHDWSNFGYQIRPPRSAFWYLAFNGAAWAMQVFLAYCGFVVVSLTATVLGTVFRYGLGGKRIIDGFRAPGTPTLPQHYEPHWDFTDKRCGLKDLDFVFLMFVGLILVINVACGVSIIWNIHLKEGADIGSAILALVTMILVPAAAFWVFMPYFGSFPPELPSQLKGKAGYVEPSPWPFGSEKLAWMLIVAVSASWVFLSWQVLCSFIPGLCE
jgi:hypothetical protein